MWHNIRLMTVLANLLIIFGSTLLLLAAFVFTLHTLRTPIQQLSVLQGAKYVEIAEITQMVKPVMRGNFFSMKLKPIQDALVDIPWVRRAQVRRKWPAQLEVVLEEHMPIGRWQELSDTKQQGSKLPSVSDSIFVNSFGEVFEADLPDEETVKLPVLLGPTDTSEKIKTRYMELVDELSALGLTPNKIALSLRLSWSVVLNNGIQMNFGRDREDAQFSERLKYFVTAYPLALVKNPGMPRRIDLRYPDGFTLAY